MESVRKSAASNSTSLSRDQKTFTVHLVVNGHLITVGEGKVVKEEDWSPPLMSLVLKKMVFGVSDQVCNKPGCTAAEDG